MHQFVVVMLVSSTSLC